MRNMRDNNELWYTYISPINLVMAIVSTLIVVFLITLALARYTPILELLPGHSNDAENSRTEMIQNLLIIDSMERVIDEIMVYNENITLIMSGKATFAHSDITRDSVAHAKSLVMPNIFDSTLRRDIEERGRYSVSTATSTLMAMPMVVPAAGTITRQFNIEEENYGVEISIAAGERILATQQGVVSLVLWSPTENYTIQLLHPDGKVSIYQNISDVTVTRGESVETGRVIGYNGERGGVDEVSANKTVKFELWDGTKPLDPERYIVF